jgi:hypothetical protein
MRLTRRLGRRKRQMITKMIRKHGGGQLVPGGVYLKNKGWELVPIPEEGGRLPAGEDITYYEVPVLLALALAPVAGLAFILFVPILVPVVTVYGLGKIIARGLSRVRGRQVSASR